jgi:hypothetical protein
MDNRFITLSVPPELKNGFFFSSDRIKMEMTERNLTDNFVYELLYYHGMDGWKPWENQEEAFLFLMNEWEVVKNQLEELYRNRDQNNARLAMKKGIGLFIQLLFWSNDQPVLLKEPIPSIPLVYQPVNLSERLAFIMSRPNLFHSFRQLSELIVEQEKLYVKKSILKKASRPNR